MTILTWSALKQLSREELETYAENKDNDVLRSLTELKDELKSFTDRFERIESELAVTKQVNKVLKNRLVDVERNCYANEQYSRRECFEIIGIPTNVKIDKLEESVCELFAKIDCTIPVDKIEAVHRIGKAQTSVIVKVSRRKDADNIRRKRKNLKDTDCTTFGLQKKVIIFDSLCNAYKSIRNKCKQLWEAKCIHGFFVSGGKVFLRVKEEDQKAHWISHIDDISKLLPDVDLSQVGYDQNTSISLTY